MNEKIEKLKDAKVEMLGNIKRLIEAYADADLNEPETQFSMAATICFKVAQSGAAAEQAAVIAILLIEELKRKEKNENIRSVVA